MTQRSVALLTIVVFFSICCFAQNKDWPLFKAQPVKHSAELKTLINNFTAIKLDTRKIVQYIHGKPNVFFRLQISKDKSWDIEMERAHIVSADYTLKVQTERGIESIPSDGDFLFKGKVKD